jgi:hypothetical protein
MLAERGVRYAGAVELPASGTDRSRAEVYQHRFDASSAHEPRVPLVFYRRLRAERP